MCQNELILKSFFINYQKSFVKTLHLWAHNDLPHELRGRRNRIPFYQKNFKNRPHFSPKSFLNYLNQLRSKISKDLKFLIGGEIVI